MENNDIKEALKRNIEEASEELSPKIEEAVSMIPAIHPAGYPFIIIFAFINILLALITPALGVVGLILTAWCMYFFRNPKRVTPVQDGLVISPADGRIVAIQKTDYPSELTDATGLKSGYRISIFLNVFNVHINRNPISGTIEQVVYRPGKFVNASFDKASEDNERSSVLVKTANGKYVSYTQIAGLIARRIINNLKKGETVTAGEIFGLIRFGSRMDIVLPEGVEPQVIVGQTMIAGETILADLNSTAKLPEGRIS